MRTKTETRPVESPLVELERSLIDEFIRARGYDPNKLSNLPGPEREELLADAAIHVSGKLAEVEARSLFVDEIHHRTPGT